VEKIFALMIVLVLFLGISQVEADAITLAGLTFDDNTFADIVISTSGDISFVGDNLENTVIGNNLNTYIRVPTEPRTGISLHVELSFTDNTIFNRTGYDLALFELFRLDDFLISLTVDGPTLFLESSSSDFVNDGGFGINLALLDLDDLGIPSGGVIDSIVIARGLAGAGPELASAGALNSQSTPFPEPATILLLGSGLIGLAGFRRKFRSECT